MTMAARHAILALALTTPLFGAMRTWVGTFSSDKWSNPANWNGGVPRSGDAVVIPAGKSTINDLPAGLQLHSLTVGAGARIQGNDIILGAGGLSTASSPYPSDDAPDLDLPITLAVSQSWNASPIAAGVGLTSLNGKTLTLNGAAVGFSGLGGGGALVLNGGAAGVYTGTSSETTITVNRGRFSVSYGVLGDMQINDGKMYVLGAWFGTITMNASMLRLESHSSCTGLRFLEATGTAGDLTLVIDPGLVGNIEVTGDVILGNATLTLQHYIARIINDKPKMIIKNDGTDPVSGTFMGVAEGAIVNSNDGNGQSFQVSYIGGDGNDVTVTPLQIVFVNATTSITSSANPSHTGETVTLTATVRAKSGGKLTPQGSVSFYDGSVLLGSSTLDASGVATIAVALPAGTHTITAGYAGSAAFASSRGAMQQSVLPPRPRPARR